MENLLEIRNLRKVYSDGTSALQGIDLSLKQGEFVAIIGPSGSGKSTLLRCVNRLIEATEGEIRFNGKDVLQASRKQVRTMRRQVGMIFQGHNLVERLSVLRNVLHGRLGYMDSFRGSMGLFSKEDVAEAMRILHRVGLADQIYKRADELSGGQQQRVGIARALAQKPQLILADEPIASLDPASSEVIMDYLHGISREDGITCIVNLHQVSVARKYATRIIGIHKGAKVFDGAPSELTDVQINAIYGKSVEKEERALAAAY